MSRGKRRAPKRTATREPATADRKGSYIMTAWADGWAEGFAAAVEFAEVGYSPEHTRRIAEGMRANFGSGGGK